MFQSSKEKNDLLEMVYILNKDRSIKNNKKSSKRNPRKKGLFGKLRFLGDYNTLKVIKKTERTEDNSNQSGVTKYIKGTK